MTLADSRLAAARTALPGCVALGYSSLSAGTLLCASADDAVLQRALVTAARATPDLFEGSRVVLPSSLCGREGGRRPDAYFETLVIESARGAQYLFLDGPDRAFVAIVSGSVDAAQLLRAARSIFPNLAAQLA